MTRYFDKEICTGCGACINVCPVNIIQLTKEKNQKGTLYTELTDPEKCIECRRCMEICPNGAIWFDSEKNSTVLNLKKPAPHVGCNLGNIAYALGNAIRDLGIGDKVIIFKKRTVEANTIYETHDYEDNSYFEDALNFKKEHPDRIVITMVPSAKTGSYQNSMEWLTKLQETGVTIIETLDWFNHSGNFSDVTPRGGDILEHVVEKNYVSFAARGSTRTPEEIRQLTGYFKTALQCQMDGRNFAMVEVVFPCFYRPLNRPQRPFTFEEDQTVRRWFSQYVMPDFKDEILKNTEEKE